MPAAGHCAVKPDPLTSAIAARTVQPVVPSAVLVTLIVAADADCAAASPTTDTSTETVRYMDGSDLGRAAPHPAARSLCCGKNGTPAEKLRGWSESPPPEGLSLLPALSGALQQLVAGGHALAVGRARG